MNPTKAFQGPVEMKEEKARRRGNMQVVERERPEKEDEEGGSAERKSE